MKILMFGRGVIAVAYGWALERAGHEIEFYVRPGRAAEYGGAIDLDLLDARRRLRGRRVVEKWPVRYRESLEPDHDFDLIVVSVQHYGLAEAVSFLAPRVGKATVLVFNNLWAEPSAAIDALPAGQVAWGFPGAGGGVGDDGVLRAALLPAAFFGTLGGPPTERAQAVRAAFREAGFRIRETTDFRGWLLIHFIQNAGLHTQSLRLGSLSKLAGNPRNIREAILATRELLPLAQARGVDLRRHRGDVLPFTAPVWLAAPVLATLMGHFPPMRRVMEAHANPEELRAVCRDTLAEARRLGVSAPRLEAAEPYFAVGQNSGPV
ncbi:ketopantoate reductase family protein [Cellulomonas chengniuliangii]|uniref:Ketopantoate reductase n=1 Tax=Cellulomonas chengniuliangii TaxID=2968084 RepID=A0ABY5KYS0_9CELL|nr:2-dehydropantoate 2-reductase N-terminal domain-containing protein [Cellulomonas chengniuliangii]MCC2307938.1 ketopantoate reductase [Cellulomonas chengniuliangii]MCC2318460.1 ketopantoate reductase [Cellulomonas chengniuliangii]UUI75314.1 ketopantoate reductase [Cellulomonas chengniuliangii]